MSPEHYFSSLIDEVNSCHSLLTISSKTRLVILFSTCKIWERDQSYEQLTYDRFLKLSTIDIAFELGLSIERGDES